MYFSVIALSLFTEMNIAGRFGSISPWLTYHSDADMIHLYTGDAFMSTETLTVRVTPEIAKRLRNLAQATNRSKSFLAAEAIEEYLAIQEWQVQAILEGIEQADQDDGVSLDQVKQHWESRNGHQTDPEG
jgi:RHH-type transcriptional regulator, rel operon repressor / antitoxin RelB